MLVADARDQAVGVELSLGETPQTDPEALEQLSLSLRRELLGLDEVAGVTQKHAGKPPPNTRAVEPLVVGALIVTVGRTAGALRVVISVVTRWLALQPARTIKLQLDGDILDVSGISSVDQERLIAAWIARHAAP